ncbi:MAG: hypothetical protein HKO03_02425, partial [Acidimicrobiia bacterium]|nr:hypothetical protein [Acidimicrobiia bacterium]
HSADGDGTAPELWVSHDGGVTWAETDIEPVGAVAKGQYQPAKMLATPYGFMGTGPIEDLSIDGDAPGFVLASADGHSWRMWPQYGFVDMAVAGDVILGAAPSDVLSWTPASGELALTGTNPTPLVAIGVLLVATGTLIVLQRRWANVS